MTKVFAYRNLHRQCWSVKALEGPLKGRVIYHASDLTLGWCDFKVSQAGRQRVLREQKKNVHAGVVGYLTDCGEIATDGIDLDVPVTYNPYKYDSFVDARCEVPVSSALFVNLNSKGKLHAYNVQVSH
jgi:hypothetical protein